MLRAALAAAVSWEPVRGDKAFVIVARSDGLASLLSWFRRGNHGGFVRALCTVLGLQLTADADDAGSGVRGN